MIRDQTRRMVERFQELMAEKEQHEAVNEDPNRDIGAMIEE
jgi:hypothetical protein